VHGRRSDADADTVDGNWKLDAAWKCTDMHSRLSDWLAASAKSWHFWNDTEIISLHAAKAACFHRKKVPGTTFGDIGSAAAWRHKTTTHGNIMGTRDEIVLSCIVEGFAVDCKREEVKEKGIVIVF